MTEMFFPVRVDFPEMSHRELRRAQATSDDSDVKSWYFLGTQEPKVQLTQRKHSVRHRKEEEIHE